MASLNQVSIEFVTQGERNMISALAKVDQGQQKLERSARSLESAIKRNIATENQAIAAYLALAKGGIEYQSVLKGLEQNSKMLGAAHQKNINGLLGVDRAAKSARDSASALSDAFKEQERVAAQNQKTARAFGQLVTEVNTYATANKSAEASAEIFARQLDRVEKVNLEVARSFGESVRAANSYTMANKSAEASAQMFTQEIERLTAKFNPLYAASKRYERQLEELNRAKQIGAVNSKQYDAALEQLNSQLRMGATAANGIGRANHIASRQTNAFGMAMQQGGYQVGDFIVQVQSGTNAFVAFGQQATQLVGILPMMAGQFGLNVTRLIAISSVLGVVIPLATALGAAFMRTRGDAKTFSDELDNLETVVSDLKSVQDVLSMSTEELGEKYGEAAVSVREYARVEAQLQASLARSEAQKSIEQLDGLIAKYGEATKVVSEFGISFDISDNLRAIERDLGLVGNEAQMVQSAFADIMGAQTFDQQRDAVDDLLSGLERMGVSLNNLPEPVAQMLLNFFKANRQIEEAEAIIKALEEGMNGAAGATEDAADAQDRLNNLLEKGRQAAFERARTNRQTIIDMENELKLQQEIARYGEDSVQVVKMRAQQEAIAKNLTEENQQKYIDLAVEIFNVKKATEDTADAAGRIDFSGAISSANGLLGVLGRIGGVLGGVLGQIGSIGFENVGKKAQVAALEAGKTVGQAGIERQLAEERARLESGSLGGLGVVGEIGINAAILAKRKELEQGLQLDERLKSLSTTSSGGGGGTALEEQEDYLAKLRQEAELKLRMIGLSEQEQRRLEIETELKRKGLSVEDKRIEQVLRAEQALRRAQEAEKRREDIMNTVSSNIETALMGLIEGTTSVEDAFKTMLRNILLEIYKQQVAKPIASGIGDLVGGLFGGGGSNAFGGTSTEMIAGGGLYANGGAFNAGRVVPFADGGVVSSPTTFPMRNGSTGLMGEAGPEAIMPLKRGKGGKLGVSAEGGGQQPVVINQSFNFAANGDESVKKIIAQEAPKIANLTQKQILDQRARGGAFKTTFG